jgi:uncharacterized protein YxeA
VVTITILATITIVVTLTIVVTITIVATLNIDKQTRYVVISDHCLLFPSVR